MIRPARSSSRISGIGEKVFMGGSLYPSRMTSVRLRSNSTAKKSPTAKSKGDLAARRDELWLLELTSTPTAAGHEERVMAWIDGWLAPRKRSRRRRSIFSIALPVDISVSRLMAKRAIGSLCIRKLDRIPVCVALRSRFRLMVIRDMEWELASARVIERQRFD